MDKINGNKTYILSWLSLAVGVVELFGMDVVPGIDASNAMTTIQAALTAIFLRHGISREAA